MRALGRSAFLRAAGLAGLAQYMLLTQPALGAGLGLFERGESWDPGSPGNFRSAPPAMALALPPTARAKEAAPVSSGPINLLPPSLQRPAKAASPVTAKENEITGSAVAPRSKTEPSVAPAKDASVKTVPIPRPNPRVEQARLEKLQANPPPEPAAPMVAAAPTETEIDPMQVGAVSNAARADLAMNDFLPELETGMPLFTGALTAVKDGEAAAPPPGGEPRDRVRELQVLQDQIAAGVGDALGEERKLRTEMDASFTKMDPKVWQDARNATAAVAFVLSGGAPSLLKQLVALSPPPAIDPRLVRGALAYIEGREQEAAEAFADIDVRKLPASMAGQVAMAQAALVAKVDPGKAIGFLDLARLVGPGTLVEEAALRREIFLTGQINDQAKFEALTRRYVERFRNSIYAADFRYRLVAALSGSRYLEDAQRFAGLDRLLEDLEPAARREIFLTIARTAAIQGKKVGADLAAARAFALAAKGSPEAARAVLYGAAALAADPARSAEAKTTVAAIDMKLLPAADRTLLNAVGVILAAVGSATRLEPAAEAPPAGQGLASADAGSIAAKPAASAADKPAASAAEKAAVSAADKGTSPPPAIARANAAMQRVDALLGGAKS